MQCYLSKLQTLLPAQVVPRAHLHDHAPAGGVGPVVGVFEAEDDVLALFHLLPHHVLNLLCALLQPAVAPPRGRRYQACISPQPSLSASS